MATLADRSLVPYHTKTYILPTAAQVPAGTFSCRVGKQGVRGVLLCLVYPMPGSPFWASCFLPSQTAQSSFPFTLPRTSEGVPETSKRVNPLPRHLHALSYTKMGEHVAHWRLMNPPPRMDITLSYPQPTKKHWSSVRSSDTP